MSRFYGFLCIVFVVIISQSIAEDRIFSAGYAEATITPATGITMPGYFEERRAEAVLDPLLAKALVLSQNDVQLAVIACDLIGIEKPVADIIKEEIKKKTGIPAEHIFLHCTHTHTGATVNEIKEKLPEQIAGAVSQAIQNKKTISVVMYGTAQENSIAFIRRYLMKDGTVKTNPGSGNPDVVRPMGEIDSTMHVITLPEAKTLLVSYGLHPDCMGGSKFSADYPYHLTQSVKASLGTEWNVIYLNACCGNVNHINVNNPNQLRGYDNSRHIGGALAGKVIEGYKNARAISLTPLSATSETVQCNYRKVPKELQDWASGQLIADSTKASKRLFNDQTPAEILKLAEKEGKEEPADITVFRLGDIGLVGLPAEIFVEISRDIKAHSLLSPTLVIGLTGGDMGYMPVYRSFHESGYESTFAAAPFDEATPLLWAETASQGLNQLYNKP